MTIILNGLSYKILSCKEKFTVADLLKELSLNPSVVAVELNGVIIKRDDFSTTQIAENDKVEIIRFMGGG